MKKFRYRKHLAVVQKGRHTPSHARLGFSKILPGVMVLAVFILGLAYVRQINNVATGGLALKQLQQERTERERSTRELELRVENLRSLTTIERTSQELDLVARATVKYLPPVPSSVAFAQ